MTPAQRESCRKRLEALRQEALGSGGIAIEPNAEAAQAGGSEDAQPLNEMLQAIASQRNATQNRVLERVQRALTKLAQDSEDFGLCEECGEAIAWGRMQAMPYAERCVACQGKQDPVRGQRRSKLTDYR